MSQGQEPTDLVGRHPESFRAVVDRDDVQAALTTAFGQRGGPHLHLSGPRGTGKTLLTRLALQEIPETPTCYISCITCDTQCRVLARLYETVSGEEINSGHHTAHLHNRVKTAIDHRDLIVVLDDVDFLLLNDGDDLLYFLSRLPAETLRLVTISADTADLGTAIDGRTYSSLQPQTIRFAPYTEAQVARILADRTRDRFERSVTDDALTHLVSTTTNVRLGLHWIDRAAEVTDDTVITADQIRPLEADALDRYRTALLAGFSRHHAIVFAAIRQLTADADRVSTGAVYDRYETLCRHQEQSPLTTRRISDFLRHLERLGLIQVDQYHGGIQGKTRHIRPTRLEEL